MDDEKKEDLRSETEDPENKETKKEDNQSSQQEAGKKSGKDTQIANFQEWLKSQPAAVQDAYAEDVKGLRSALQKEREDRKNVKEQYDEAKIESLRATEKWEELSTALQEKVVALTDKTTTLETVTKERDALSGFVAEYVSSTITAVPEAMKALLEKLSPMEQAEYLLKHGGELAKNEKKPTIPPTPSPIDPKKLDDEDARKRAFKARL